MKKPHISAVSGIDLGIDIGICIAYAYNMISFLVKLSKLQLKALRALSARGGLSVSEHIRRAVDLYLSTKDEK